MSRVPTSRLVALAALAAAAAVHASAVFLTDGNDVEIAGGQTTLAAEGTSFASLAMGVETPEPPQEMQEAPQPTARPPVAADPVQPAQPQVQQARAPIATVPLTPGIEILQPVAEATPQKPADPPRHAAAPQETQAAEVPAAERPDRPDPDRADPVPVQETAAAKPVEPALEPTPQAPEVTVSLKPVTRPTPQLEPAKAPPKPQPEQPVERVTKRQDAPTKPRGNSDTDATRGVSEGRAAKPGGQARTEGGTAKAQGNAAASNYPGLVMRRIQRAKRRANVRGEAMVAFRIGPGGGLAGVSLARSSGSARLDEIAVAQVRRAAPFPPPPPGARTSFTVRIKGK
ncbi:energy transducer TonB [Phycobacter sp. K97]|uniref:energy transducer TonB n=1 Tax=Phycobacter sedimenti TaxID=3133977 RepID=UPI00311D88AE